MGTPELINCNGRAYKTFCEIPGNDKDVMAKKAMCTLLGQRKDTPNKKCTSESTVHGRHKGNNQVFDALFTDKSMRAIMHAALQKKWAQTPDGFQLTTSTPNRGYVALINKYIQKIGKKSNMSLASLAVGYTEISHAKRLDIPLFEIKNGDRNPRTVNSIIADIKKKWKQAKSSEHVLIVFCLMDDRQFEKLPELMKQIGTLKATYKNTALSILINSNEDKLALKTITMGEAAFSKSRTRTEYAESFSVGRKSASLMRLDKGSQKFINAARRVNGALVNQTISVNVGRNTPKAIYRAVVKQLPKNKQSAFAKTYKIKLTNIPDGWNFQKVQDHLRVSLFYYYPIAGLQFEAHIQPKKIERMELSAEYVFIKQHENMANDGQTNITLKLLNDTGLGTIGIANTALQCMEGISSACAMNMAYAGYLRFLGIDEGTNAFDVFNLAPYSLAHLLPHGEHASAWRKSTEGDSVNIIQPRQGLHSLATFFEDKSHQSHSKVINVTMPKNARESSIVAGFLKIGKAIDALYRLNEIDGEPVLVGSDMMRPLFGELLIHIK